MIKIQKQILNGKEKILHLFEPDYTLYDLENYKQFLIRYSPAPELYNFETMTLDHISSAIVNANGDLVFFR